jgi:hypothetical protein
VQRWNGILATVAQGYAEMCVFDPNPDRAVQAAALSFDDTVGENRAFGRTTNYTELIERGWFVQRTNFNFTVNMCLSLGACDEYMQVCTIHLIAKYVITDNIALFIICTIRANKRTRKLTVKLGQFVNASY